MLGRKTNKIVIVFSGYNERALISFLRTLDGVGIDYAIIASSKYDSIFLTEYKNSVIVTREKEDLSICDIIKNIALVKRTSKYNKCLIAPSTEALNRFLLDNKDKLEKEGCEIPLVGKDLYEKISDKYKFRNICIENGILVPDEYENVEFAKLPFVAKPKEYASKEGKSHKPMLVFEEEDRKSFIKEFDADDFYYQKFIGGKSFYLLYYFSKEGDVYRFSQENHIQQPEGKSIIGAISSDFHLSDESKKYEKLFKKIGFVGLVMVEVKNFDEKNYMIEANPRFWGPSQLFIDAGINLFMPFLFDHDLSGDINCAKKGKKNIRYFWSNGLRDVILTGGKVAYHNYDYNLYENDIEKWKRADIYNRSDTIKLYKEK